MRRNCWRPGVFLWKCGPCKPVLPAVEGIGNIPASGILRLCRSTAIHEDDNTASLALALEVAGYFDLDAGKAREIAAQVGKAVSKWREEAARHALTKTEIERIASAFEHGDLTAALQV